ncbi:MAG: imidazole glycerol phosphate synthase subunit HisH [Solirubrobacteraceae bacterium]
MSAGEPQPRIAVLDYGMGNRRSVQKALEHVGARATITRDHHELRAADGLVIPGVGAFPLAMRNLHELGLTEPIRAIAARGTPLLGICLGMQLLLETSTELEATDGLGLIAGEVTRLQTGGLRIPHIGWNDVSWQRGCALSTGLPADGCPFYHVHSFAARPGDPADVVGVAEYGEPFASIVARENVYGVQFHPEKSSRHGLAMLGSFAALCGSVSGTPPAGGPRAARAPAGRA